MSFEGLKSIRENGPQGQAFRSQPMGLCLEGHPRQPQRCSSQQRGAGPTSTVLRLRPSVSPLRPELSLSGVIQQITVISTSPRQTPANERNVNQVFLIIFRHRIENHIDAEMKRVASLRFAAGRAGVGPIAKLIALPSATEVVLAINHRCSVAKRKGF